jgi:hypothetical protein
MNMHLLIAFSLGLCVILFWAAMTDRLTPASAAARSVVTMALITLAIVATLFAVLWVVIVGSLVFN